VSGIRRAVVGASGSPGSLRALRYAQELARAHNATLIPVLAWVPPGGDLADRRSPCGYLRRDGAEDAHQGLRDALTAPWGGIPADPPIQPLGERREAGWVLVSIASPGDLLVVGQGTAGRWPGWSAARSAATPWPTPGARSWLSPRPALPQEMSHGLLGWGLWHRPLTPDQIRQDRGKAAA